MKAEIIHMFDDIRNVMVSADGEPMGEGRAPGLHLSDVIKRLRDLKGGKQAPADWQGGTAMFMGFTWERALEVAFHAMGVKGRRDYVQKQLKLSLDGISGTPDGFNFRDSILEEYKYTNKSLRRMLPKQDDGLTFEERYSAEFWEWEMQTLGYLKMVREQLGIPAVQVDLFPLFGRGDYSFTGDGSGARLLWVRLTYEPERIDENWNQILRIAADMRPDEPAERGEQ